MTFGEIISESLKQGDTVKNLSAPYIIISVSVALICSLVIYFVYKKFYRGAVYSESFNILNVMLCLITAFVITTISSNLVLSLGMVGALSIVRFRSAVKDPLDIGFLFWSIAAGITTGAGLFPFAIISTIIIAAVYIIFSVLTTGRKTYLLVIKYYEAADESIRRSLEPFLIHLRAKTCIRDNLSLHIRLKLKETIHHSYQEYQTLRV